MRGNRGNRVGPNGVQLAVPSLVFIIRVPGITFILMTPERGAACVSSWIKGREKHLIVVILNALNIDLDGIEKHLGTCLFYLKKPLSQAAAAQS